MRIRIGLAVWAAAAGMLVAAHAVALPLSGVPQPFVDASALPVVQVHGCHFDMGPGMEPDRANGPHYHNRECNVVRTGPQGGYGGAPQGGYRAPPRPDYGAQPRGGYGGGYGGRYDDGPRRGGYRGDGYGRGYGYAPPPREPYCRERCRYTGPFKKCRTVCE